MIYKNFEDYLQTLFNRRFTGTKDQIEEAYETWFQNLGADEMMDYADLYGETIKKHYEER